MRPLIDVSRKQVRAYLRSRGLAWREDSSNLDERYDRNRIRARLLPALSRDWNPRVEQALARSARQASEDEEYWRLEVADRADRLFAGSAGRVEFETSRLGGMHPALLGRLLREAVRRARGSLDGIDFEHIERLKTLVASGRGAGRVDLPGLRAERSLDRVRLVLRDQSDKREEGEEGFPERRITQPGEYLSPDGKGSICLQFGSKTEKGRYNDSAWSFLDWEKTPRPLLLRSWRSGDRLRTAGAEAPRKLKRLFQRARIARWDRAGWPVLAVEDSAGEERSLLVWARGFGASADFAAGAESRVVVRVAALGLER